MKQMSYIGSFIFLSLIHAIIPTAASATQAQKVKWVYSAFTGAYAPVWIAYERNLDRKYDLELELTYAVQSQTDATPAQRRNQLYFQYEHKHC